VLFRGKAYGIFDMKWLYIASLVLFEGGSALCGGAPSMNVCALAIAVSNAVAYEADTGLDCRESNCRCWWRRHVSRVSTVCRTIHRSRTDSDRALNILTGLTTEHERPVYMSLLGVCWGVGTILGPVIGGAFAGGSATWRWVSVLARLPGSLAITDR